MTAPIDPAAHVDLVAQVDPVDRRLAELRALALDPAADLGRRQSAGRLWFSIASASGRPYGPDEAGDLASVVLALP